MERTPHPHRLAERVLRQGELFYAILHRHGWIKRDDLWVTVCLEPLRQPNRHHAQELLCRKLTGLGAKIPGGKSLRIEVGSAPSWAEGSTVQKKRPF
ncbi:MAG: hypothetical protein ABW185_04445 [Sedimenticola sp.]